MHRFHNFPLLLSRRLFAMTYSYSLLGRVGRLIFTHSLTRGNGMPACRWPRLVADLEEPAPPHLGDGLTPSLMVCLIYGKRWSFYCETR